MRKLKTTFIFAAVLAVLVMVQGGAPISASAASDSVKVSVTYKQTEARSMLSMINEFRTGSDAWYWNSDNKTKTTCSGLSELTYDYNLEKIAMQRAAEIALSFSHTRPDGTTCFTAYSEAGYSYSACGENIAAGYTSAKSAFTAWQETNYDYYNQGHRRNMLSSYYNACAVACVYYNGYYYWVQEFARTSTSSSSTSANNSATKVSVNVSESQIYSCSLSASPDSITLKDGGSASLPTLTAKIRFNEGFSSASVTVPCTWKVKDSTYASISGSKVKAEKVGDTKLITTFMGQKVKVPLSVRKGTLSKGESYTVGDFVYKITSAKTNGNGTVTVTGPASNKLTSAAIPATVKISGVKFKVTKIASKAFSGCTQLQTVTTGKNVATIGSQAFSGCTKMTKVTIKAGTTKIGKKAFYNCKNLKTIKIKSKKLTTVGKNAFKGIKSTAKIVVPESKYNSYKKLLADKGQGSKVKITK